MHDYTTSLDVQLATMTINALVAVSASLSEFDSTADTSQVCVVVA